MIEKAAGKRLYIFLLMTFATTWTAWWSLATIARPSGGVFAQPLSVAVFSIGGLGPTIAAFAAVALTKSEGTMREYLGRLFRWRVNPMWWLAALAVPPMVAWLIEQFDLWSTSTPAHAIPLEPLSRLAVLFPLMLLGGGLEELGWRGVAQPELQRRYNRFLAIVLVALCWALWHLPLFFIPGTSQEGTNFGLFALQILGTTFFTAWLYDGTRSILLCVLFHAAVNASSAMGLSATDVSVVSELLGGAARLAIGIVLFMSVGRSMREPVY